MLLYLASLKYDPSNLKSRVIRDLEQAQFGSIEALLNLFQGQSYRVTTSCFGGSTDTQAGMRFRQPHEVPVRTSHACIECGGSHVLDRHPPLAKWLLDKR